MVDESVILPRLEKSTVAVAETEWIIQRLLVLYFFKGLSSCHKIVKDRKQIVGSIEWGMRDWKEKGWISSGSLACAIADEHSWNVFEELGWHPAKRTREREAQAESKARQGERARERAGRNEAQAERGIELWWSRPTAYRSPSSGILLWYWTSRPVWPVPLPPGTLHAPGQQPTPWLSPAGSMSSSNITKRWVRTESVAFFYFNWDFSVFSVRSGV